MATQQELTPLMLLQMRERVLSLAADFDRFTRQTETSIDDPRLRQLREALEIAADAEPNRAQRVQMIFSDTTPPPGYRIRR